MFDNNETYKILFRELLNTTKFKKIKKMGAEHYGIAMYLFQISNHIGLFHFNSYSLTDELGLSKYKINNIFKELQEIDFIRYDKDNSVILIVDMLKYTNTSLSASRNAQVKALRRQLAEISDTLKIKREFYNLYKDEDNYSILFTKYLEKEVEKYENKTETAKKEEDAKSFVALYNNITDTKNKVKVRSGKNIVNKIQELKDKYELTQEQFISYCLNEDIIDKYESISEILNIIEKDLSLKSIEKMINEKPPIQFEDEVVEKETFIEDKENSKELKINVDDFLKNWGIS